MKTNNENENQTKEDTFQFIFKLILIGNSGRFLIKKNKNKRSKYKASNLGHSRNGKI